MLVSDIITSAFRLLGAIASGETPTSTEQSDAFFALNAMIDSWNTQKQMRPATQRYVFTLQVNKQSYTIGASAADILTARPLSIRKAGLLNIAVTPALETPLALYTEGEWAAIAVKGLSSQIPEGIYFENDYPNAQLNVWPVPTAINQVALYMDQLLPQFGTVGDTVSLPPGYVKALRYSLACELAPELGKALSPLLIGQAQAAVQYIKSINFTPIERLRAGDWAASGGAWDYRTGETH